MHNSTILAFLVSVIAVAPLAGMWKAHADAKAEGWRLRRPAKSAGFALRTHGEAA